MPNFQPNGTLVSFILSACILYLFSATIDVFISEAAVNKTLKIILVIICLIIAFAGSFFIKIG